MSAVHDVLHPQAGLHQPIGVYPAFTKNAKINLAGSWFSGHLVYAY